MIEEKGYQLGSLEALDLEDKLISTINLVPPKFPLESFTHQHPREFNLHRLVLPT